MQRRYWLLFAVLALALLDVVVLLFVLSGRPRVLTVAFLDVGQGDAILIESPAGRQMLVDGGRDRSVLRELGRELGPFDRSLDMIVATHPDADHIGGLPAVFAQYDVAHYLSPGIESDTNPSRALLAATERERSLAPGLARRGMRILLGGDAYADILFPDRDVSEIETNTGSVIMRVVYGETAFLLSGDAPESVENYLVSLDEPGLESEVLKAGHHGSRTSTGEALLAAANPALVVISAGKDNSYGHPHEETLQRIGASGAAVASTMGEGAVVLVSDGKAITER